MAQPRFTYELEPSAVLVGSDTALTLTLVAGEDADLDDQLAIRVQLPIGTHADDLLDPSAAAAVAASVQAPDWSAAVHTRDEGRVFEVYISPTRPVSITAGASVDVVIRPFLVNQVVSPSGATLRVFERWGDASGEAAVFQLSKRARGQSIVAFARPPRVAPGQPCTITYTVSGGAEVSLRGNGEQQRHELDAGEGPLWSNSFEVVPDPERSQTVYELTVSSAGGGERRSTLVCVEVGSPTIRRFELSPASSVGLADPVTIEWAVDFASFVDLDPLAELSAAEDARVVTLGDRLRANQSGLDVTLTAVGVPRPAQLRRRVEFAPVEISYFCFAGPDDDSIVGPITSNATGQRVWTEGEDAFVAEATGPHGPVRRTLGGSAPQVRYFGPYAARLSAAAKDHRLDYCVQGFAANDTLVLQPGERSLSLDADGCGSVLVDVEETTDFTLVATLGGEEIRNTLTVYVDAP